MTRRPQFPTLFALPGERCPKMQFRSDGRVDLQCVRRVHGPETRHLMDITDRDAGVQAPPAPAPVEIAWTKTEGDWTARVEGRAVARLFGVGTEWRWRTLGELPDHGGDELLERAFRQAETAIRARVRRAA